MPPAYPQSWHSDHVPSTHSLARSLSLCPHQVKSVDYSGMNCTDSGKSTYRILSDSWGLKSASGELSLPKTLHLLNLSLSDKGQTLLDLHEFETFSLLLSDSLCSVAARHPKKEALLSVKTRGRMINAKIPKKGLKPMLLSSCNGFAFYLMK